jgi:hypothetical protein
MTATHRRVPAVGFIGLGDQGAPMAQAMAIGASTSTSGPAGRRAWKP